MYTRERINSIRRLDTILFHGIMESPQLVFGGYSMSYFLGNRSEYDSMDHIEYQDRIENISPAVYIVWDEKENEYVFC